MPFEMPAIGAAVVSWSIVPGNAEDFYPHRRERVKKANFKTSLISPAYWSRMMFPYPASVAGLASIHATKPHKPANLTSDSQNNMSSSSIDLNWDWSAARSRGPNA